MIVMKTNCFSELRTSGALKFVRPRLLLSLMAMFTLLSACGPQNMPQPVEEAVTEASPEELLPDLMEPEITPPPKKVILIIIDTLRADYVGAYGNPDAVSPALDALAAQGVQFDDVLAQCSWTRPSIGSFLTSLYPRTLGLYLEKGEILADRFTTLAEVLQQNGFKTLGLTANPNINSAFNFHQGFDLHVDSNVLFDWMKPEEDTVSRNQQSLPKANALFKKALDWIAQSPPEEAAYIQFNLMEVHEWVVRRRISDMLRKEYATGFKPGPYVKYPRLVRQVTDDIGAFVSQVQEQPGWEDTLFVFLSDHGEGLGDHPDVKLSEYHGRLLYESQLRVPMIFYRKGWRPERSRIQQTVRLLDFMPTLLDLLAISGPEEMQGLSLMPLLRGESETVDMPPLMVMETNFKYVGKTAIYGGEWKFIHSKAPHVGIAPNELQARGYGAENGIKTNRYADHPELSKEWQAWLSDWETRFPPAPPTPPQSAIPQETQDQLESIGYIE